MTDSLYYCSGDFFDSYLNGLPLKDQCNIDLVFPQPISFCYSFCELAITNITVTPTSCV